MKEERRKEISKRWRRAKMKGRLYWRDNNQHWRDWDSGEIARSVEEVGGHKFYSVEALEEWIEAVGDEPNPADIFTPRFEE